MLTLRIFGCTSKEEACLVRGAMLEALNAKDAVGVTVIDAHDSFSICIGERNDDDAKFEVELIKD